MDEADLACLRAAKGGGLIRRCGGNLACPTSSTPSFGWWAKSNWSDHQEDTSLGGPWSIERVHALCERGYLGVGVSQGNRAELTKLGRDAIKPSKASQAPVASDGEAAEAAADNATASNPPPTTPSEEG